MIAEELRYKIEEFTQLGSGWRLTNLRQLTVKKAEYNPLRGGVRTYVKQLFDNRLILSKYASCSKTEVKDLCFYYAIQCHDYLEKYHQLPSSISELSNNINYNFENINFPVSIPTGVKRFNDENKSKIQINIFGLEDYLFPMYVEEQRSNVNHINLLYYDSHFHLIRNLSGCVKKYNGFHKNKHYLMCPRCFCMIDTRYMQNHKQLCQQSQRLMVGDKTKKILYFQDYEKCERIPFNIYADFECTNLKSQECIGTQNVIQTSHQINSYGWNLTIDRDLEFNLPLPKELTETNYKIQYAKDDTEMAAVELIHEFIDDLKKVAYVILLYLIDIQSKSKEWKISKQEEITFQQQSKCYHCKEFILDNKVRDHNHWTGKFRGAAHEKCNLRSKLSILNFHLPIGFHNFSHYDSFPLIYYLQKHKNMTMIGDGNEIKALYIDKRLKFYDTYLFIPKSLKKIAKELKENELFYTRQSFPDPDIRSKGIYPYTYIDSIDKLNQSEFPSYENFYDVLSDSIPISFQEYEDAKKIYEDKLKCNSFKDYHTYYLLLDVVLLSDIMYWFRQFIRQQFELEAAHFISMSHLTWTNALKYTQVKLDIIQDPSMFMLFEGGLRGGITHISKRYSKSSPKNNQYIVYDDANNLYGWAMSQKLPTANFKWFEQYQNNGNQEFNKLYQQFKNNHQGSVWMVDLDYPEYLHEQHSDYPLAPEKITPFKEDLNLNFSKYEKSSNHQKKLICHLKTRFNYIVYDENLKFYIEQGLRILQIHCILYFQEKAWLLPFVSHVTMLREYFSQESTFSLFKQSICKNSVNMCFGRTIINTRKHTNNTIYSIKYDEKKIKRCIQSPLMKRWQTTMYNVIITKRKPTIRLMQPIYIGFTILEMSKLHMYKYYYQVVKKLYDQVRLCMTDTDSYILEIKDKNFIKKRRYQNKTYMDTSEFPTHSSLKNMDHCKKLGYFKDETYKGKDAQYVNEFVGIRSKMYCLKLENGDCKKAMKGIKDRKHLNYAEFMKALVNRQSFYCTNRNIQILDYRPCTKKGIKVALNGEDDKRFILYSGLDSSAIGHYQNVN